MRLVLARFFLAICTLGAATPALAELSMCLRKDAAPFSSMNEQGRIVGYTAELCRLVADKIEPGDVSIIPVSVEDRFEILEAGRCQMLCGATTVTMTRRDSFEFSLITFVTDTAFLFPRRLMNGIAETQEPLQVGYLKNTTAHESIADGDIFSGDNLKIELTAFESHVDAEEALQSGVIESYIADRDILNAIVEGQTGLRESHVISTRGLTYEPYAIAIQKDQHDLRRQVDQALAEFFRDGTIWQLVGKHIPSRRSDALLEAFLKIQSIPE